MKRKILSLFVIAILIFSMQTASALSSYENATVEYLDNGDCIVTIIETVSPVNGIMPLASNTETKSKTSYYKNTAGDTMWYVRVTGTFTYGDGISKCISVTPSAASYTSDWKVSNISGSKSGNKASATATGKQYYAGEVIDSITKTVTLTCSPTDVFS